MKLSLETNGYQITFKYCRETDIADVYFTKNHNYSKSMELLNGGLLLDVDPSGKYISAEIMDASEVLSCHFLGGNTIINDKYPAVLEVCHNEAEDKLTILFCNYHAGNETTEKKISENFSAQMIKLAGKSYISGFIISNVSTVIAQ